MNYQLNLIYVDMMESQRKQIFLLENLLNEKGAYANIQANEIVLWRKSYSKVHVTSGLHQEAGTRAPHVQISAKYGDDLYLYKYFKVRFVYIWYLLTQKCLKCLLAILPPT